MEYKDFLYEGYINGKLNQKGLNDLIKIILNDKIELQQKVIDLEFELIKLKPSKEA